MVLAQSRPSVTLSLRLRVPQEKSHAKAQRRKVLKQVTNASLCTFLHTRYPYFLQFLCRELFDAYLQNGEGLSVSEATRKVDSDFSMGRWQPWVDSQ